MSGTFIENHGVYSVVKQGQSIYRGKTDAFEVNAAGAFLKRSMLAGGNTYFGLDSLSTTANYGITVQLLVNADLRLLNISDTTAHRQLAEQMRAENQLEALAALHRSFPVQQGAVHRDSVGKYDRLVLDFICRFTRYDGYIQPEIRKTAAEGGFMHSEMAICQRSLGLITEFIGRAAQPPPPGRTYASLKDEERDWRLKHELEQRRLQAKRARPVRVGAPNQLRFDVDADAGPPLKKGKNLFHQDDDERGPVLSRNLFG